MGDDLHLAPIEALESHFEMERVVSPSKGKGKGKSSKNSCGTVEITPLYEPHLEETVKNESSEAAVACPVCGKIENGLMIACDSCDGWYHCFCVGISQEPAPDLNWFCSQCDEKELTDNTDDNINYDEDIIQADCETPSITAPETTNQLSKPTEEEQLVAGVVEDVQPHQNENRDGSDWITVTKKERKGKKRLQSNASKIESTKNKFQEGQRIKTKS